METYIKHHMVPRSLRWEVCPQRGEAQLEEWYKYFNDAGFNYLKFLVEKKANKLLRIDEEIKNIKEKLIPLKSSEEYGERSNFLKNLLKKKIENKKLKRKRNITGTWMIISLKWCLSGRRNY